MRKRALEWDVEGQATLQGIHSLAHEEKNVACLVALTPGSLPMRSKGIHHLYLISQMSLGLDCLIV